MGGDGAPPGSPRSPRASIPGTVCWYTDGLTEARIRSGEMLGEDGLVGALTDLLAGLRVSPCCTPARKPPIVP
jgi:hypothetical protein